jgi:hypothetical protein
LILCKVKHRIAVGNSRSSLYPSRDLIMNLIIAAGLEAAGRR